MTLFSVHRRPRLWPLLLSGLAIFGLAYAVPELHKRFEITHHGVRALGWVTGKGGERSGIVYYAYRANEQTYGGQYKLSSLDSDFEMTHNGDAVNVIYLSTKPYISQVGDDPHFSLRVEQVFCFLWLILFLLGFWLSGVFAHKRGIPDATSSPG